MITLLTAVLHTALAGGAAAPPPPPVDFGYLPATATARPPGADDKPHPVQARLLSEHGAVVAGSKVRLGVYLEQDPEWHTYWRTPGDIGLPTTIKWTLPEGASAGPQVFPIPVRYEQDGMVSYGYDHQVLQTAWIELPSTLAPGRVTIEADVDWLVCKTSCIPGAVHLALPLDVAGAAAPSPAAPLFTHYEALQPGPLPETLTVHAALDQAPLVPEAAFRAAFVVRAAAGHTLTVPAATPTWPTFTAIGGSDWMPTKTTVLPQPDGGVVLTVEGMAFAPEKLPEKDAVGGLLQVQVDGQWVRTELSTPLVWAAAGTPRVGSDDPIWKALSAAAPEAAPAAPAAQAVADAPPVPAPAEAAAPATPGQLLFNLLMAFVGGLILNIMPCVLPVLTLKLYSLVEQGDISHAERRTAGMAYTGGILVSFWALALGVVVLRSMFSLDVGWGFQFQYPGYVAALATVVYLFGLSLLGVFELPAVGAERADELGTKEGAVGYFFTGVFATLVATPCSAPFLGTAIAFAFSAPTAMLVAVFTAIGLGLAAPFLLVAYVPAAWKVLPRPGPWMESVKHLLGFSLMATTLWLVSVLGAQIGFDHTIGFLVFLLGVSVGAWIYGHFGGVAASFADQLRAAAAGVAVAAFVASRWLVLDMAPPESCDDGTSVSADLSYGEAIPWQPFHEKRLEALAGKTLFVDFTADWCVSCKVNEHTVLESASVRGAMERLGVVPLKADWTRKDDVIGAWLKRFGRAGVPMYLVIPPQGVSKAELLPEVITPDMVIQALERAGTQCPVTPC